MIGISLTIIFILLLLIGIILIPITYLVSNEVLYTHEVHVELGDYSSASAPLPALSGDIKIVGNVNRSVQLYLIKGPYQEHYLGNFSGTINITTSDDGYTELFIFNNQYPSKVDLLITIYNTSFAAIGYTLAGIFLGISSILALYAIKFNKSNQKKYEVRKIRREKGKDRKQKDRNK